MLRALEGDICTTTWSVKDLHEGPLHIGDYLPSGPKQPPRSGAYERP